MLSDKTKQTGSNNMDQLNHTTKRGKCKHLNYAKAQPFHKNTLTLTVNLLQMQIITIKNNTLIFNITQFTLYLLFTKTTMLALLKNNASIRLLTLKYYIYNFLINYN